MCDNVKPSSPPDSLTSAVRFIQPNGQSIFAHRHGKKLPPTGFIKFGMIRNQIHLRKTKPAKIMANKIQKFFGNSLASVFRLYKQGA